MVIYKVTFLLLLAWATCIDDWPHKMAAESCSSFVIAEDQIYAIFVI